MDGRRRDVHNLLLRGSSTTLLGTAPAEARTLLEQAYELAWREPPLPGPVRHLVAYRLAHVLMRVAADAADLTRAEALFAQAAEPDLLGPLPWIYRLAPLQRLGRTGDGALDEICRGARACLARGPAEVPPGIDAPDLRLLELACYFTGRPFDLEGRGGVLDGVAPARFEPWVVVGGGGAGLALRMPEAWAVAEVAEHAEHADDPRLVLFQLGAVHGRWRTPHQPWRPAHVAQLRLLATLLSEPASRSDLERRALAESSDRGGTVRQYKYRLEVEIRELLGEPELPVFSPAPRGAVFELAPELRAVGAVQARLLET